MKLKPDIISLKVSNGWFVWKNEIFEIEPTLWDRESYEYDFDGYFDNEMFSATHFASQVVIEVGWTRYSDPSGQFILKKYNPIDMVDKVSLPFGINPDWLNPEIIYTGNKLQDLVEALNKVMMDLTSKY